MAKHPAKHSERGLVNAVKGSNSALTLLATDGFNFTGWDVKGDVVDDSPKIPGVWSAKRLMTGDPKKELRLSLTCKTEPKKDVAPDGGTLTVTLQQTGKMDETVTTPADYNNDPPPP